MVCNRAFYLFVGGILLLGCQDERVVFQDRFITECMYESQYGEQSEAGCKCLSEFYMEGLQALTNKELAFLNKKEGCKSPGDIECMTAHRKKAFMDEELNRIMQAHSDEFAKGLQECIANKQGAQQ